MFDRIGDLWRVRADYRQPGFAAVRVIGCALVIAIATAADPSSRLAAAVDDGAFGSNEPPPQGASLLQFPRTDLRRILGKEVRSASDQAMGRIVDLLFTAGVTVISLITVIYSLLFAVVQWVGSAFSLRLALFRDDPIVWRAFAYSIGIFVFCFTAAFAIGNRKTVSVVVPVLALLLVLAALVFMRTLQTRALVSMLLAPNLDAITERGREILDGLYLQPAADDSAAGAPLPPPLRPRAGLRTRSKLHRRASGAAPAPPSSIT